jgi:hypothetical protein
LESLLQERNAAQPEVRQQPLLQDVESSVPLSSWVDSLRHEVEVGPRPKTPDINPFDLDAFVEPTDGIFAEDLGALSMNEASQDGDVFNAMRIFRRTLPSYKVRLSSRKRSKTSA